MARIPVIFIIMESLAYVHGAKILMASVQFGSHIIVQSSLAEELVSRGHQVYMALASRYPRPESMENRGIKTLFYDVPQNELYGVSEDMERVMADIVFRLKTQGEIMAATGVLASELTYRDCALMMNDQRFIDKVRNIDFDLAVIDPFLPGPCNLILPKYLGIPFVSMSGLFLPWTIRLPAFPSFIPLLETWVSSSEITLSSRLVNLAKYAFSQRMFKSMMVENNTLLQKYAPDFGTWDDILILSELFLVESDYHYNVLIPEMPYYITVAGQTATKAKKLPNELENILENSPDGAILLSFGSTANYFPKEVIVKFLTAFSKLNQTVIAKFIVPEDVKLTNNVKVLSWLPQNDILGHPKTKLFITHCGYNGQYEALYHGVPMIGFPLFAEQHMNCLRAYKKGFGLQMSIHDFTSDQLFDNIQEVLNNPTYRLSIGNASERFREQPLQPREKAAFWIEHVIKHGGNHLRSPAMDMPLYEFLMLDVLGLAIVIICVIVLLLDRLIRIVCRYHKHSHSKIKSH